MLLFLLPAAGLNDEFWPTAEELLSEARLFVKICLCAVSITSSETYVEDTLFRETEYYVTVLSIWLQGQKNNGPSLKNVPRASQVPLLLPAPITLSWCCLSTFYHFLLFAALIQQAYFHFLRILIQTGPTSGYIQAGVELGLLHIFAAELSTQLLEGCLSLPQSWLQTADPLHVLLCQSRLTHIKTQSNKRNCCCCISAIVNQNLTILSRSLWTLLFSKWIFS